MKILILASEMAPFAKTGGLGDAVGGLARSLAGFGEEVRVVLPLYTPVREGIPEPTVLTESYRLPFSKRQDTVGIGEWISPEGLSVHLILNDRHFGREGLYGTADGDYPDNAERFSGFTVAGLEVCKFLDWSPDIVHVHDWQTALAPAYLRSRYANDPILGKAKSVLTIHNLAYQGRFPKKAYGLLELPEDDDSIDQMEFFGDVSFLKGGIVFADLITTVSERYAAEIQTEEYGCGLDGLLRHMGGKLKGILNGADYQEWDPRWDPYLPYRYDSDHLDNKRKARAFLVDECGFSETSAPIIGMVTRLSEQKGIDLIARSIDRLMAMNLSLVVLGAGDRRYEEMLQGVARRFPGRVSVFTWFDNTLAHRIEAGADMFLMPSRYEPCGLSQIYSLRYGTVPIVRATGGLDDTIQPFDATTEQGNGFKFKEYAPESMLAAVRQALGVFAQQPVWERLMKNGMSASFRWEFSTRKYLDLYRELCPG